MQYIIFYGIIGAGVAVSIVGLGLFINYKRKEKKVLKYKENFEKLFAENRDIRQTMSNLLGTYKKNSTESDAIKAGLYYLDHSVLQDYDTALEFITTAFDDDRIEELHKDSIVAIWQMRQKTYSLPNKEVSDDNVE